jgi:hypothetical protein
MTLHDRSEGPFQPAFYFPCGPQTAGNHASHVKLNQLFDGKACGRSGSRLFFLRKEIATGPCGTGYRIGSFACVFETTIGDAAERDSSRSPSPNPIG